MRCTCLPRLVASLAGALLLAVATPAGAQGQPPLPPPSPPPPPAQGQPPPGQYQDNVPPPTYGQPGPGQYEAQGQGGPPPSQPQVTYQSAPPPAVMQPPPEPEVETHAPKYSLWAGARLSYVGFGFSFYENERGAPETTGNYLGNGVAPQIDVGARISYRYIPYLYWEHGFMGQGHRFEGTDATSSTDYYGLGFRYISGDVDSVAFLTDLSVGRRVISVSNGTQSYSMSGLEWFRLGLGAEIRVATLFTITPLASISTGAVNDADGDIEFACKTTCVDGVSGRPTYRSGARKVIDTARQYVVLSIGAGIHFDIFGK